MQDFVYKSNRSHVIFGTGTIAQLGAELHRLGSKKPLFLSTPQQSEQVAGMAAAFGGENTLLFDKARMHTPSDITDEAEKILRESGADGLVAIGGGSTIGLGKALALRSGLPQLVVPTTYAGSEMTPILGETANGEKRTINDERVLPNAVIYDVDLTMSLPAKMAGLSGMNAIAHAVEALYAREANPVTSLFAVEAIGSLARALPDIAADPSDREARGNALYGAWLSGICLGVAGMALHHKLCHTLGGMFDLPHAETHTIVLPHALAYNSVAIPGTMDKLRLALQTDDPALELYKIGKSIGAPQGLKSIGMPAENVERVVQAALARPYWNPRPLEKAGLTELVGNAYEGAPPRSDR